MSSSAPQAGVDYPRSFHELVAWFGDEEACLRYLERVSWGEGFVCRFCGTVGGDWWAVRRGMRRCAACRKETSVTAGPIFHGSQLSLNRWFAAVWYVVNQSRASARWACKACWASGLWQLPDRVGMAAQAAPGDGASGPRAAR